MNSLVLRTSLGLALASLAGCTVSTTDNRDDYVDRPVGAVGGDDADFSVEWTIEGSTDPDACFDYAVDHAYITIEDDVGIVDEVEVDCEAFAYDAPPLPPGRYYATIVLRDANHDDATVVAETDARSLPPGGSDYVTFDFRPDSFL